MLLGCAYGSLRLCIRAANKDKWTHHERTRHVLPTLHTGWGKLYLRWNPCPTLAPPFVAAQRKRILPKPAVVAAKSCALSCFCFSLRLRQSSEESESW